MLLLLSLLASTDAALPFKKVSIAKTPVSTSSTTSTTTEAPAVEEEEVEEEQPVPTADSSDGSKVTSLDSGKELPQPLTFNPPFFSVGQWHSVEKLQADWHPADRLHLGSQFAQGTERVRHVSKSWYI